MFMETSWSPPSVDLSLSEDEIHIWRINLDQAQNLTNLADILSKDERERAARFHFERDARRFTVGRAALRMILGRYLNLAAAKIAFNYSQYQKPELAVGAGKLQFNLSNSNEIAICGVRLNHAIGIDIEYHRPINYREIGERFFSAREQAVFRQVAEHQQQAAFYRCWTRKEAFIKAIGEGLSKPLDSFDVTLAVDEPARFLNIDNDPAETARWSLYEIDVEKEYTAALATDGRAEKFAYWQWRNG
jgi:4'-phosphopantetheinyl transferase